MPRVFNEGGTSGTPSTVDTTARAQIAQILAVSGTLPIAANKLIYADSKWWENPGPGTLAVPSPANATTMTAAGFIELAVSGKNHTEQTIATADPAGVPAADMPAGADAEDGDTHSITYDDAWVFFRVIAGSWARIDTTARTVSVMYSPVTEGQTAVPGQSYSANTAAAAFAGPALSTDTRPAEVGDPTVLSLQLILPDGTAPGQFIVIVVEPGVADLPVYLDGKVTLVLGVPQGVYQYADIGINTLIWNNVHWAPHFGATS